MADNLLRLSKETQDSLVRYANIVLDLHSRTSAYRDKMEFIDVAYARYQTEQATNPGEDRSGAANQPCGVNVNDITVPIVVSQVDAYVGYFADAWLSGFPLFPVVSSYQDRSEAEQLESIIDDHSIRGRYARQLLLNFRNCAKYNFSAIELDWCPLNIYNVTDALTQLGTQNSKGQNKLAPETFYINQLNTWDTYNTIWDYRVHPVDVPYHGEYAGELSIISRIELKRELAYYNATGNGYNTTQALQSALAGRAEATGFQYYTERPQITELVVNKDLHRLGLFDWISWIRGQKQGNMASRIAMMSDVYERLKLYVRLVPNEHGMHGVPNAGTPQVWKLVFINHEKLVYAARVYSLYDMIPVFFGQPFEDGFGMQTKSIAENGIPFQQAASDLFSIRMNSARRAVVDRAIYDPKALNSADVNAPYPAAKIPLRDGQTLAGKKLDDVYKHIPFDSRGTETVIQDMGQVINMADMLNGINQGIQGQRVKGNKTRKEWDDTQEGAKNKMRLPAIGIEYQQMIPIKEQIRLNIFQYGVDGAFQSQTNAQVYQINAQKLQEMRKKVMSFKVADGLTPADRLASTPVIQEGMAMIQQSPLLQASLGPVLPHMFVHFMSLGGVKSFEQYLPQIDKAAQAAPPQAPPAGTAPAQTPPTGA